MKLNANFQSKQPAVEEAPCEVSKVICLTDKEYAFFRKHLMYDYDFLRKNADGMGFRNGIRQCVLVMGKPLRTVCWWTAAVTAMPGTPRLFWEPEATWPCGNRICW